MADKLHGRAIALNSVSLGKFVEGIQFEAAQFDSAINDFINVGGRPFISNITYFGSNTTANINGDQTITLTGQNFQTNVQVYINGNATPSVSRTNANSVSFTTAAESAGTYLVYAINPDGGFAVLVPGIVYE